MHFIALAGKWPVLIEPKLLFACFRGNAIYGQVFEEMHSGFARGCQIDVSIAVQIHGNDLGPDAGGSIYRDRIAEKPATLAFDLVVVDDEWVIRTRIVAGMTAIALPRNQLGLSISVDVG
jgi:hypothetical protein